MISKHREQILVLAILVGINASPLNTADVRSVCSTPDCVSIGESLLESMDPTADPCQDFFQYACGGWIKKHPIPESKSRWTQFDILRDQLTATLKEILNEPIDSADPKPVNNAKDFYTSCMDKTTVENLGLIRLTDWMAGFGGWPMVMEDWTGSSFDWKFATTMARKAFGSTYLIDVYNDIDVQNTNRSTIYIDQGSLALPRGNLVNPESSANIMAAYASYAIGAAKAVRDSLQSDATDEQIEADVEDMWKFESELAKITTPPEDRRNNTRMYNPLMVIEVQGWTDQVGTSTLQSKIDWSWYLNNIYSSPNIDISNEERVIVVETQYLQKLCLLLNKTPPRVLSNYINWRLVNDLASLTTQQMNDLQFQFSKVLYGISKPEERSITCVNQVNNLMGFAVSAKYVEKTFDETAKSAIDMMIPSLKTAFKSLVDGASWMDSATKTIARDKVNSMSQFVAYPDWIKNKTALEAYYQMNSYTISKTELFNNVQFTTSFLNQKYLKTLREQTDRQKWITFPSIVNAFYAPEYNSITFPAGILQPPFFGSKGRLAAMNYGGIGVVIGHEITHGFDDQGRQSDKYGNTVQWWTETTLSNYLTRAQCFIDQYSNFTVASGSHLNGVTTQGENIADNGGLRESFKAYSYYVSAYGAEPKLPGLENMTAAQIFFLSYANIWCGTETPERLENQILTDPHSPSRYRVLGPLSNSEDFSREFKCAAGTPMNRLNKCVLW